MSANKNDNSRNCFGACFMPDGKPMPELMTEDELVHLLRLDIDGPTNPHLTLKYYRDEGLLRPTRVSRQYRYQKKEVLNFLDRLTERTNKKTAG